MTTTYLKRSGGIVAADTLEDLFWAVDEYGDPTRFEYSPLLSGEGLFFSIKPVDVDIDGISPDSLEDYTQPLFGALNDPNRQWLPLELVHDAAYDAARIGIETH